VDPGSTHSIVKCPFIDGVQNKKLIKEKVSYYKIAGGKFRMNFEAKLLGISLPEFSQTNFAQHRFSSIIGQDLCKVLGLDINCSDCIIQMNERSVALKSSNCPVRQGMTSPREVRQVIARSEEPKVTAEATERIVQILDGDYHKADL
jgi:hypothetical protein